MTVAGTAPGLGDRVELSHVLIVGGIASFTLALAKSFPQLANGLTWNADLVSPMVIADSVATSTGHQDIVFGSYAPYTSVWFNLLTRRLPFHRELWESGPLILSLLGVSLLVWISWRLAGRWAALTTLAIGVAWSQPVLITFIAQAIHGTTYFVVCLLAAFLVLIAGRRRPPAVTVAATAVVGVVAGVNLASDALLLIVGIGPLVGAAVLAAVRSWSQSTRRALVLALAATGVALGVSTVTAGVMKAAGYRALGVSTGSPLALASVHGILGNAGRLAENVLDIWSADFLGRGISLTTLGRIILAGPALAIAALPVILLVRALRCPAPAEEANPEWLYVMFWGLVVGALFAGLVLSRLAVENADRSIGYLTPVVLAGAATLPLVAARVRCLRLGVAICASLLCILGAVDLLLPAKVRPGIPDLAYVPEGPALIAALRSHGLTKGYAGYGAASVLTYQSDGAFTVRPVLPCLLPPSRQSVCGFFANRLASWYVAEPGVPTFLVTDPTLPLGVPSPPAEFGPPTQVIPIGVETIYVYSYDIAARFGPTY